MLQQASRVTDKKSNCVNTLSKFYNPHVEAVEKLKFYDPDMLKDSFYISNNPSSKRFSIDHKEASLVTNLNLPHLQVNNNFHSNKETERSQKSNKLENQKKEQDLENKRNIIIIRISEKKIDRNNLIDQIASMEKEITDINLDLDLISTYGREGEPEQKNQTNYEIEPPKSPKKKSIFTRKPTQSEERKPRVVNVFKFIVNKKKQEIDQRNSSLDKARQKRFYMKEDLKIVENELNNLKRELKRVTTQLLAHYHNLLNEGTDTRQEGLSWIIKAINGLGSKVILSSLPNFLDEGSIKYLFNYCFWEIEFSKLKQERMKIKNDFRKLHEKTGTNEEKNKMNSTFKTGLEDKVNENNKDCTRTGFFDPNLLNKKSNTYIKESEYYDTFDENKTKQKGTSVMKKSLENRFLNSYCLTDNSEKIKHFNTKGINIQTSSIDSHLNINVDKLNIKTVEDYLNSKDKMDISSNLLLKDLFEIDGKIAKMKSFMMNMRKNEMNRLMKQFNTNDYERRFKTTKFAVISALIGEENTIAELNRQTREQKSFADRIKQFRSFNVMEKNEGLKSHNVQESYDNIRNAFLQNTTQSIGFKSNFSTKNVTSSNIMFNATNAMTNTNFAGVTSSNYFNNTRRLYDKTTSNFS